MDVFLHEVQHYVLHCTLLVCNSYMRCLCTSPPVHSIPYTVSSSWISATVSAALLAIALCKSDIWLQSGKIGEYPTKHIQGSSSFWYLKILLQPRQIMTCSHVILLQGTTPAPIEKQSGQQVLYACHFPECICLNGVNISCYPINTSPVWFILKQTHKEMRVPSWRLFPGGRHELWWKVVLGNHINSTAHWDALYSYDLEWRITEREHKFNTGALLQCSKVINPPGKRIRLCSNQSK